MNRITAVLLAMAALLVHVLAIHRDGGGHLARSFEAANVAYELGVTLAEDGAPRWDAPEGAEPGDLASYPSPLLVWLAALLRALSMDVERAVQLIGVMCTLATVFLSTRFDRDRIAGVIPALLLVSSGTVAAAGASGTEWPLAMFALTLSFVALEHRQPRSAAIGLAMLVLSSPAGVAASAVLGVQTLLRRRRPEPGLAPAPLLPFVFAGLAFAAAHLAGGALTPGLADMARLDAGSIGQGSRQLLDHLVATATPVLLAFPLLVLLRGRLSPPGRRALGLTFSWCAFVVLCGGGPAPYGIAFAPALPVAFMAIQQGMARLLDTYLRSMERLVWASMAVAIGAGILASRFPGDFGRFALRRAHERAFATRAAGSFGDIDIVGRASLYSEIQLTVFLREVADFLGERLPAGTTILSPWPGTLGRRTELVVIDAFGRAAALPGGERAPWAPLPGEFDARAALAAEPEYILPTNQSLDVYLSSAPEEFLPHGLLALDPANGEELRRDVRAALALYEPVVTVGGSFTETGPLLLLQRRGLGQTRSLDWENDGDALRLTVVNEGASGEARTALPQVFDVVLEAALEDGTTALLDPEGAQARGRISLRGVLMDPLWERAVTLAEVRPEQLGALPAAPVRLTARLLHHRIDPADPRADAADPIELPLR
ncbi:MAG: hypothetical protein VX460_12680 [Planctomycetota bacterium]|nr:hypothetical protein [Planctomycetota bacterium]